VNIEQRICDFIMEAIVRIAFGFWFIVAATWGYLLRPIYVAWKEVFTLDWLEPLDMVDVCGDAEKYQGWNFKRQRERQKKMDYALLWAYYQSKKDQTKRFIYESVKGPAVNLQRMPEANMFWTDGVQMGFWPKGWDEGFRDLDLERRILVAGPKNQFDGQFNGATSE